MRLTIFWVSPPNNSYDDHLEVINIYSQEYNRPDPFQCWECYQPPVYYYVSATVLNISKFFGLRDYTCWKIVQLINPLLSIIVLYLAYKILSLINVKESLIALTMSILVFLPRDIFTSVMIGNDYMLVFFSVLSLYYYTIVIKKLNKGKKINVWVCALVLSSLLGSLTKQHGLLLYILPLTIATVLYFKSNYRSLYFVIPVLFLGIFLSLSEEIRKYNKTGELLVSNQHFFDYAKGQFPGDLKKVEFHTFRISELYREPFISEKTSASFFTELYARTFFDYEWRFLDPKIPLTKNLGRILYSTGLIWLILLIVSMVIIIRDYIKKSIKLNLNDITQKFIPILLSILFFLVPLIQTIRYPYFSSMKSMFMLPGIIIFIIIFSSFMNEYSYKKSIGNLLIFINISSGLLLLFGLYHLTGLSLDNLSGPLWTIP